MLDIFVGEPFAVGTLGETDSFPKRPIIGLAVDGVEVLDGGAASDAYRHTWP